MAKGAAFRMVRADRHLRRSTTGEAWRVFARKLVSAFALLAILAIVYGASAWWIAAEAEHRVMRGRVAADLYRGAAILEVEVAALRGLVASGLADEFEVAIDPRPIVDSLADKHVALLRLAGEARRMDVERGKALDEHLVRERLLADVAAGIARLGQDLAEARAAAANGSVAADEAPLARLDQRLRPEGTLPRAVAAAVAFERDEVERERVVADEGLARVRFVALAAMAGFCATAFALALFLYRLMRRPLAELTEGLRAFEAERLDHRIPELRRDEFGLLAASANRMAERLATSRAAEATLRRSLERRVAERTARLQRAIGDLEQADRRRQLLFADIGHELRTPATVIRGEAEVALRGKTEDAAPYREALARIVDGARQLSRVIDDLLVVAREDADGLRIDARPLDANAVLARMLPPPGTPGPPVEREIAPGAARVVADEMRLRQVIGILLDNALRYSPEGAPVIVGARVVDGVWRLEIRDRGIGIGPEDRERVFERGFRGREARRVRADGSGLGLPIARMLVERHGGRLVLESAGPGLGTTASVELPLDEGAAGELEEAS